VVVLARRTRSSGCGLDGSPGGRGAAAATPLGRRRLSLGCPPADAGANGGRGGGASPGTPADAEMRLASPRPGSALRASAAALAAAPVSMGSAPMSLGSNFASASSGTGGLGSSGSSTAALRGGGTPGVSPGSAPRQLRRGSPQGKRGGALSLVLGVEASAGSACAALGGLARPGGPAGVATEPHSPAAPRRRRRPRQPQTLLVPMRCALPRVGCLGPARRVGRRRRRRPRRPCGAAAALVRFAPRLAPTLTLP